MGWYQTLYEGNGRGEGPSGPRPRGFRLLLDILRWHWWTLVKTNILFWLCCLPLITIPAALKAMTRVCVLLLRGEPLDLWQDWWQGFRRGFGRATWLGLAAALVLSAAGFGVGFYGGGMVENGLLAAPALVLLSAMAVEAMALPGLFCLLEFSELGAGDAVRSALLLVLVRLPQHLAVLALLAALALLYLLAFPYSSIALAAIVLALFWLTACFAAWPGLEKYVFHTAEDPEEPKESGPEDEAP